MVSNYWIRSKIRKFTGFLKTQAFTGGKQFKIRAKRSNQRIRKNAKICTGMLIFCGESNKICPIEI